MANMVSPPTDGICTRAQEGQRVGVGDEGDVDVPANRGAGAQVWPQRVVDVEVERGVFVPVAGKNVLFDLGRLGQPVGDRVAGRDAAEIARKADLLGVGQVLVVEHQHLVLQ
ncbi:MAG: hypothetical protein WDM85_14890 [Caulobacteraceae bacterium]